MMVLTSYLLMLATFGSAFATDRHYFISADEVEWNYAPSGTNKVNGDNTHASEFIETRADRIGATYTKLLYRAYTDATFTTLVTQPSWAGFVGPLIKAEVNDDVFIHFRNNAINIQRHVSIHPHGYFYEKGHEGAVYIDGTSGTDGLDNAIAPGQTFTYHWQADRLHRPFSNDFHDKCAAFTYHSHVLAAKDVDTGLMGVCIICEQGTLDANMNRKDFDEEFFIYADIADENNNWYIEHNLQKCGNSTTCTTLHNNGDEDFVASNEMAHINGYVYGNMPDIEVCEGKRTVWYFMSVQRGIHTIHISGQTMIIERKRTDTANLHPASVYSADMRPMNPGRWLIYSRNQDFYDDGMQAFLQIDACQTSTTARNFYIAIEEGDWDYAPGTVTTPDSGTFLDSGPQRIGAIYRKATFIEYSDETFSTTSPREIHWGLAGPPIKAQVNEHVVVKIWNKSNRTFSFLANGVALTKSNEGALYVDDPLASQASGKLVPAGSIVTYEFDVNEAVGPEPEDEACITYMYHSAVDFNRDIHTGLFGPLLVCKAGTLASDGSMIGVDREFYLNWMVVDENLSWYIDDNIATLSGPTTGLSTDEDFLLSNQMRAINGRSFGTLDGLDMEIGENVVWCIYGLGGQIDHHHVSFEGNNFEYDSRQIDTASVFSGIGRTLVMTPDQTGIGMLVRDAQLGMEHEGMFARYNVRDGAGQAPPISLYDELVPGQRGIKRTYYIGIVEEDWEYCANKIDPVDGHTLLDPDHPGYIFVRTDGYFLGSNFRKVLFREFTDDQFTTQKTRTSDELHMGMLGPFIRANANDEIEIVLKNFATSPYNIVPRNAVFSDGSPITEAPATDPNQIRTYTYFIPERSGPTPDQPNCVGNIYTSRVNPLKDPHSGLLGPIVVCKRGILDASGTRTDNVAKEFAGAFVIYDENLSNLRDSNFVTDDGSSIPPTVTNDGDFYESNLFHSINGYIYANQPPIVFSVGEHVAWYFFGFGGQEGIHTIHTHGQVYLRKTSITIRRDVAEVWAGTAETVEMEGYNPGTWLYHCHLAEHAVEGMESAYTVVDNAARRKRSSRLSFIDKKQRLSSKRKDNKKGTLTRRGILKR